MSLYNFKKIAVVPPAKVSKNNPYSSYLQPFTQLTGLHRHHLVENTTENPNRRAQKLQNQPNTFVLHAKGQIHATKLPRQTHADTNRLPEARRRPPVLRGLNERPVR